MCVCVRLGDDDDHDEELSNADGVTAPADVICVCLSFCVLAYGKVGFRHTGKQRRRVAEVTNRPRCPPRALLTCCRSLLLLACVCCCVFSMCCSFRMSFFFFFPFSSCVYLFSRPLLQCGGYLRAQCCLPFVVVSVLVGVCVSGCTFLLREPPLLCGVPPRYSDAIHSALLDRPPCSEAHPL